MIAMTRPLRSFLPTLLLAAAVAGPAAAKPLYITVPRTYGTHESPVVEVAFESRGPVELRVLKPQDLEGFLRSQANLRRAWQEPPSQANPGHALSRGLNALRSPGSWLLYALDVKAREAIAPALPARPPPGAGPVSRLAEGSAKLVGIPAGMQLVRSQWLNLDLGGSERAFDVPGFEGWYDANSGFQERRVGLAPLPVGVYVLQLVQRRIEGQVVLVVSDLAVQVKQTDGELLARVAGRDGGPRQGAEVAVRLPSGGWVRGTTDARGEAFLKVSEPRVLVTARVGDDLAVVDTDFYSTLAVTPDVFIYSDRPIYKPGDTVRFRGLLRQPDSFLARLFTPRTKQVEVQLVAQEGTQAALRLPVDEFGSFAGELRAPAPAATGILRLVARVDGRPHQSEARVQEYVKPTFYVEVLPEGETVTPGSQLRAKVRARRYAGGPAAGAAYEVFLYRTMLESPAWIDDAGLGGKGSDITYGSAPTTEGTLSVPERLYSSLAARADAAGAEPWATAARFDAAGEATIVVDVPALRPGDERLPWRYSLSIRARDDQGTFANAAQSFFLAPSEVLASLRPSAAVVLAGTPASLSIRATTLSGKPYGATSGTAEIVLRRADGEERPLARHDVQTGNDGVASVPLPVAAIGTVVARVRLQDRQGRPWEGEASMLVVGEHGEPVARVPALTLQAIHTTLEPGDRAQLVALFPDDAPAGAAAPRNAWITLSGAGIYSTLLVPVRGTTLVHEFQIEERFGSAVFASVAYPSGTRRWEERTVSFRIVPSERTLKVEVRPAVLEARPLGTQVVDLRVTDARGRGRIAQVSVGVVDKAIYALQTELRPAILDFFYPLTRDNVASFDASDFQGLGYGEPIAAALRGPGRVRFAAVKPPSRQRGAREEDTAYFNPSIVTDPQGHARVRFELPANQTEWVLTAVAADAGGRFGEGRAEFASRGGMSLIAALPQFLRTGDEAVGSVRLAGPVSAAAAAGSTASGRENEKAALQRVELRLAVSGSLAGAAVAETLELAPQAERLVSLPVTASGEGTGQVTLTVAGAETLRDRKAVPVRPSAVTESVRLSARGGGRVALELPPGARVRSSELVLQPTLVDVALSQVHELLEYPFGCLEQLVSTTIPNVALYRTLERSGALAKLDPPTRALLAEARSRAVQGVERVLQLAVPGGGFTWFRGYATPSIAMTLVALDGLVYAAEAGLVEPVDPRIRDAATWLAAQPSLPPTLEATRTYVLARLEGGKQAARVRAQLEKAGDADLYTAAISALAAEHAGIGDEPQVKQQVHALAARAGDAMFKPAAGSSAADAWLYPLRPIGLGAILVHAASRGDVDVAKARGRLVELLSQDRASTFDRATALLHSLWLVERDARELKAMVAPEVRAPGVRAIALAPRGAGLAATLPEGVREVEVAPFEGVATLRAEVTVPLERIEPIAEGMTIARRYSVLRESGRKLLEPGDKVAPGEDVYVELAIDAHAGEAALSARSAYYIVEDAVPAGFSPLVEDKEYRGAPYALPLTHEALRRRALGPEKATFFFEEPTWWSASPRVVGYVMRAQFPGRFSAPPATVQDMYAPRIRGRTAPAVLEIEATGKPPELAVP